MSAAAAGPILGAVGTYVKGESTAAGYEYNATMNRQTAQIARQNAIDKAMQTARANYLRLGSMQATAGATGASKSPGFLDVLADSASQMKLQEQNILYGGELDESRYKNAANRADDQALWSRFSGYLGAAGDLMGGMGSRGGLSMSGGGTPAAEFNDYDT